MKPKSAIIIDLPAGGFLSACTAAQVTLREAVQAGLSVGAKARMGRVVLTNGNFDFLHYGHIAFLRFCKEVGDGCVFVAVDDDLAVRKQKGEGRPIFPLKERMACLAAVRWVDCVFPFDGDIEEVVKILKPDVLVKGEEWRGKVKGAQYAGEVMYAPRVYDPSCRDILQRIKKGK